MTEEKSAAHKITVGFLAIWLQATLVGVPCVLWGWTGFWAALAVWTLFYGSWTLGKYADDD